MPSTPTREPTNQSWYVVSRWQEYEGEGRVNLLRVLAVAGFYAVQLVHFLGFSDHSPAEQQFHRYATLLAAAWLFVCFGILIALQRRFFPFYLKYVTTLADLLLVSALASLGNGPASPLTNVYFIVLAAAALRLSLPLVWFATPVTMVCYLSLVALKDGKWFDEVHSTPVVNQLAMLLSLLLTGIVLGQVVRRARWLAEDYARRSPQTDKPREAA